MQIHEDTTSSDDSTESNSNEIGVCMRDGCCNMKCTFKLAHFIVIVIISVMTLVLSALGFIGIFQISEIDSSVFYSLFVFVLGVWLPNPKIKREK